MQNQLSDDQAKQVEAYLRVYDAPSNSNVEGGSWSAIEAQIIEAIRGPFMEFEALVAASSDPVSTEVLVVALREHIERSRATEAAPAGRVISVESLMSDIFQATP